MNKKIVSCLICMLFAFVTLSLISCGDKISKKEKEYNKVQNLYNKKGLDEFIKYVNKQSYLPIKDSNSNEATPLLIAIEKQNIDAAKLFLDKGAVIEEKDSNGRDAIDYALKSNDAQILDFAISLMPSTYWNTKDLNGCLPVVKIIEDSNSFNSIKKVFSLTNNFNAMDNKGKSLLMYAAQCNIDVQTVKYLLDNGCDINLKNDNEWTALMYAARYNPNPAVMEDLILRGADSEPNSVGLTVTMLASCNPNPGVLMALLKYKNEINSATDKGKTALMYACENGQTSSVIKTLIDNGADLYAKDSNGKFVREYLSENPSLSTNDMAIAWKSADETNASDLKKEEKNTNEKSDLSETGFENSDEQDLNNTEN